MKETGIGAAVPAGKFDRALNVIEGNNNLYELMGIYIHFSFYKKVCEADKARLEQTVERCVRAAGGCAEELIHIENEQAGLDTFLISMRQCQDKAYFYIEFYNMSADRQRMEDMNRKLMLTRDYLTLNGNMMSEYRPAADMFRLFWLNHEQTVEIYRMSLEEWEQKMLCEKRIKEEDKDIFTAFCEAMKKTEDIQGFKFGSSIFTNGERLETYRIKLLQRNYDGEDIILGMWSVIDDRTEKEFENYAEGAYVDSLTRLLNKKTITEYAQRAVEGQDKQLAIAVMDIDNFKNVNDTYGHLFGDQVIKAVADVIKKVIGGKGMAGRIGGDEFMFILEEYEDEINLRNYLRSIKVNVAALFQDKLGSNGLSCSIGVSRSDVEGGEFKDLFKTADKALYIAKQKGKNRYIIYKKEMHGHLAGGDNTNDMLDIRKSYYSDADIRQMNRLLSDAVLQGSRTFAPLLEQMAHTVLADRIVVFWGKDKKAAELVASYREAYVDTIEEAVILEEEEYLKGFRNDCCLVSNVNALEYSIPSVYGLLKRAGVFSSMQYLLRDADGTVRGMVLADECKAIRSFPKIAVHIFENTCEIIRGVLIREENS